MKHKLNKDSKHDVVSNRLFAFGSIVVILFVVIIYQFYKLQIIDHSMYDEALTATVQKEVEIPSIRGIIYDRYGKPLAINKAVYVLKYDPEVSLKSKQRDTVLLNIAKTLEENGDSYIDNVPISKTVPFVFTGDTQEVRTFITNYVPYNDNEHKQELYTYTADEMMAYLRGEHVFDLDKSFSDEEARKIIAIRLEILKTTYQRYKEVTIAHNVSMKSLAYIEENQADFPSITSQVESQRYYLYGEEMGNLLGYTRHITESQYETLKEKGYEKDDIVGQVGIEGELESELKGEKGNKIIQVDNVGRTVFTLEAKEAQAGNDVYLTIDADLQVKTYRTLEKRLSEAIIQRLRGGAKTVPLTAHDIIVSMARNNQIDLKAMSESTSETQKQLYAKIIASYEKEKARLLEKEKGLPEAERTQLTTKEHFSNMLEDNQITDRELVIAFAEQGTLPLSKEQLNQVKLGNSNLASLIVNKLESGELKPSQMDITPSSGTAVVTDPNTGETLALVSYPSYDSNEFTQNFNKTYTKLNDGIDNRNLMINRALKTAKAPGSTFKMVMGVAGLETGVITPTTMIYDSGQYMKAGYPYVNCWIFTNTGRGHGDENVVGALEVSCNYFFNDVAYRLGQKYGAPYGGIGVISDYAKMFGLGDKTGIELEETAPNISNPENNVKTQASRAINNLIYMKDKNKETLYSNISENLSTGFYSLGDKYRQDEAGKVEYLSAPYIKGLIDTELGIALSEDLEVIYNKMIEDYKEEFDAGIISYTQEVANKVIAGDNSLTLKYRTKEELYQLLKDLVQPGTRKTIQKALDKLSIESLDNTFIEAYEATLSKYKGDAAYKDTMIAIQNRIEQIKQGSYSVEQHLIDKIIERIIYVYLDDTFKSVQMEWTTAINIRTAIGQGNNTFTPVQIARYTAGLANGKQVYDMTIINGIKDNKNTGDYIENKPKVFNELKLKPSTIQSIHEGMLAVSKGDKGTARTYFQDFPIDVASKTGTAEEGKYENSWFNSFAPYDKPEVVVVTSMYGTDGLGSYNTQFAKDIYELYFKLNDKVINNTHSNILVD